jgi:hypothetical protein
MAVHPSFFLDQFQAGQVKRSSTTPLLFPQPFLHPGERRQGIIFGFLTLIDVLKSESPIKEIDLPFSTYMVVTIFVPSFEILAITQTINVPRQEARLNIYELS